MITAFAASKAADDVYDINWRWGFGCFAIIFPVVAAPLYFVLKYNLRKSRELGATTKEKSNRTIIQSIWYWFVEFDRKLSMLLPDMLVY